MSEHILYVSDATFDTEVLQSPVPVLVDFWAEWCVPCRALSPVIEQIAGDDKYTGKLKVVKLNIDENPESPSKYAVRGIPTVILFKNGNVGATSVGAKSKAEMVAFIDHNL